MIRKLSALLLTGCLILAGCGSDMNNPPPLSGSGTSTTSKNTAPLTDILLSGAQNGHFGAGLTDDDRSAAAHAERRAFTAPLQQQVTWSNDASGHKGTITALRDGYAANGSYCREFQQTIQIDGQQQQAYDKACQQPDGSWKIVQ